MKTKVKTEGPIEYKAFSGSSELRDQFRAWLIASESSRATVTGGWDAQNEWQSSGVEFLCLDQSLLKDIKKDWQKKGVIIERKDIGVS